MRSSVLARLALPLFLGCAFLAAPGLPALLPPAQAEPHVSGLAVDAAKAAFAGNFKDAGSLAQRSGDAAAIKLVELIYLRDHPQEAGYSRIMDFLNQAPDWPLAESLIKRAERTLYQNNEPAEVVLQHFAKRKPVTPEGTLALARAMRAQGNEPVARKLVQAVWYNPAIDAQLEKAVAAEFKDELSADDNRQRMWRLIYAQETNAAVRMAGKLSGDYQKAAKVAQALIRGVAGADKQYAKLPSAMRGEPGLKYSLARYYRRNEAYSKAAAVLATVPGDAAAMGDPEAWWVERRIVARHSIGPSHPDRAAVAYQIAKANGIATGPSAVEAEFLAGWIALRYLDAPSKAMKHFTRLAEIAPTRTEQARAHYWLGRTYEALGQKGDAVSHYREAAQHTTVYYGQLAREKIGRGSVPEEIESGTPSKAAQARIDQDEVVRAFKIVAETGRKADLGIFLWAFANRFKTTDDMNAAANVVWGEGGAYMSVKLAKAAAAQNIDIDSWSYPIRGLPDWKPVGKPVEKALVFGLSRQESEFNPTAGSAVGAQGLMQIMPGTAKLIAKQHGLTYTPGKLTSDPAYNVKLGAAHLGDLVDNFGGSYVLTLVAYNAGPRRSREWVQEYGDLRGGSVDPIDWVESIPFQETRQYVQKVLQNVHVYRSRLAPDTVRPMTADLARGGNSKIEVTASVDKAPAPCDAKSITQLISACE
jgi:soluble lytic murein transglycosylase